MNLKKYHDQLLFVPLGGCGEIGMNLNLYHLDGKWIVVDCGIGFADDYYPGADIIVPDTSFIESIKKDIIGMVITHAHEDHVGGIPYLWEEFECPVYTTAFTANFLKLKLMEVPFGKKVKIHEIKPNQKFDLGPFSIEPVELTHSIPEMNAMAIRTRYGVIMHTGDWKFDRAPVLGPESNYKSLQEIGEKGALAIVCDSTNVFSKGHSGSEDEVQKNLIDLVKSCKQRVAIGTFASNLGRVTSIIKAADAAGRKVVVAGRSFWRLIEAARASGYLGDAPVFYSDQEYGRIPRDKCLLLCTGSQAEPRAALSRIAEGTHQSVKLLPGDTVILSSKIIPGNDVKIYRMLNLLTHLGVEIITEKEYPIHVSGHPYREELVKMYEYTKPQIAIPVHGEARHIKEHAKLARSLGVKHAVEPKNGDVIRLAPNSPEKVEVVKAGRFAIDGYNFLAGDSEIMKYRRRMKTSGAVMISAVMDNKGKLLSLPLISAPGLLEEKYDADLMQEMAEDLSEALDGKKDTNTAREAAKKVVRRYVKEDMDKNPVIEIHITKL